MPGAYASSEALLDAALAGFPDFGLQVLARSSWRQTAAWPDPAGPAYRNGVAIVEANAEPHDMLSRLLALEAQFGRVRSVRNAPRTLDLDLIAHGRIVLDAPGLTLPHPRAHERRFVMGPLAEVAPGWVHPVTGQTAAALAASLR